MKALHTSIFASSLLLGLLASDLSACVKRDASATAKVLVRQIDATTWRVLVPGYTSVVTASGSYCAVGLSVPSAGAVTTVSSVSLIGADASSMPAIVFAPKAAVGSAFQAKKAGNWTGFLAKTSAAIAAGKKLVYAFTVKVKTGTTLVSLTTALKASDVGSDAATVSGSLAGGSLQSIFRVATVNEQVLWTNARRFHNDLSANISTRATVDSADTLVFMQPRDFRNGQGDGSGWQLRLQDQDASTAELVKMGFSAYSSNTAVTPDLTAAGTLTSVQYTLFGTGSGAQATIYTLTTSLGVALPAFSGIRLELPKPAKDFPADGLTIAVQDGDTTFLPSAQRKQWTYVANGTAATAFRPAGSTMQLSGLYDCGTCQALTVSKAYGPVRRLAGAESISANATASEAVAFRIQNKKFASSVALVLIAPGYGTVHTSPFKNYLLQVFVTNAVVATDAQGIGQSIGFPVPPNVSLAAQGIFFNFTNLSFEFGDACRFTTH